MREEQKIILSLYYINPRVKPSNIKEVRCSVGMDMLQLLLLMEGVFERKEYKYYIKDKKIQGKPTADNDKDYQGLVEQENRELKEAQVLAVQHDGRYGFQDLEYMKIDTYCEDLPDAKKHLYFFNILMNNINGVSLLGERETLVCYRLFSNRGGKEFISCLLSMIVKLVSAFLVGEKEEADEVIETLNKDYELIEKAYNGGQVFLENMCNREYEMRYLYQFNFFVNQSEMFETWVMERQEAIKKGNALEFIFYNNKTFKNYSLNFMLHIAKISRILMQDERRVIFWEEKFDLNSIPEMREFYNLDYLVSKLEEDGMDSSFDTIGWINDYIAKLFAFARELKL